MATQEDRDEQAIKFPRDKNQYELTTVVHQTNSSTTYKAKYVNPATGINIPVRIKILDTYKIEDIYSSIGEIHEAGACQHENIVKVHCSFMFDNQLWVIMTSLSRHSLRSVIRASFPNGLPKKNVGFILKQTLEALNHMHTKNKLHGNLDAGHIFLDNESRIKVAFGSLTYDKNYSESGYPSWAMAPELMKDYKQGNSKESDVWMLGLLALELFYGRIPASDFKEFQLLMVAIEDKFRVAKKKNNGGVLGSSRKLGFLSCFMKHENNKIPGALGEFMAACLRMDPRTRPTTNELMEYKLFKTSFSGEKSLEKLNRAWEN